MASVEQYSEPEPTLQNLSQEVLDLIGDETNPYLNPDLLISVGIFEINCPGGDGCVYGISCAKEHGKIVVSKTKERVINGKLIYDAKERYAWDEEGLKDGLGQTMGGSKRELTAVDLAKIEKNLKLIRRNLELASLIADNEGVQEVIERAVQEEHGDASVGGMIKLTQDLMKQYGADEEVVAWALQHCATLAEKEKKFTDG